MIYECTDCKNCASFDDGYRIVCLNWELAADKVYDFQPLGDKDARDCPGFDEGDPHEFSMNDFIEAEAGILDDEIAEEGIRRWCMAKDEIRKVREAIKRMRRDGMVGDDDRN